MLFDVDRSLRVKEVPLVLTKLENAHDAVEKDVVVLDDVPISSHLALRFEVNLDSYGCTSCRVGGCPLGDHVVKFHGEKELPAIETLQELLFYYLGEISTEDYIKAHKYQK